MSNFVDYVKIHCKRGTEEQVLHTFAVKNIFPREVLTVVTEVVEATLS